MQLFSCLCYFLLAHALVDALLLRRVDFHQVYLRRSSPLPSIRLLVLRIQLRKARVSELRFAEGHVAAAAGLLFHELKDQMFEQVEEEDEVFALGLLPKHLLGECLVDSFLRLGAVPAAGNASVEESRQEALDLLVANCLLVRIGAQPKSGGSGSAAIEDATVSNLFEDAPQNQEVKERVGGPAFGEEVVEEAQAGLLGHEVVERVDDVDQQLLGPQFVTQRGDGASIEPLCEADVSYLCGFLLVLLPEALVAVLHQFAQTQQRHPLRVNVDLNAAVQLLEPLQLAHPHRTRQLLLATVQPSGLLPPFRLTAVVGVAIDLFIVVGVECIGIEFELCDVLVVLLLEVDVGVSDEFNAHLLLGL